MSDDPAVPLLVPSNPSNVFNNPYNVGLLGGSIVGVLSGYVFSRHFYPLVRRVFSAVYTGHTKLALVVNADLHMSKGKIASQCSHASVMAYKRMRSPLQSVRYGSGLLTSWDLNGQAKVVLRAENLQVMKKLEQMAREKNIPVHKVHDAGRTEIPEGSLTVMGLGPAPIFLIDQVTGHLRLL